MKRLIVGLILGLLFTSAGLIAQTPEPLQSVYSTAALRALDLTAAPFGVERLSVSGVSGDAPPVKFMPDVNHVCSTDDGGYCVSAHGNGFWLANVSGPEDVREWGSACNGSSDDTSALNLAFSTGRALIFPTNSTCIVSNSINLTTPYQLINGNDATLQLSLPANSPAVPVLFIQRAATGADVFHLNINENGHSLIANTICGANPVCGSSVLIMADYASFRDFQFVENGWTNGISVGYINGSVGVAGEPIGAQVTNGTTLSNGFVGNGVPGYGFGVGNECGSRTKISNIVDVGSGIGFGEDVGCGANGTYNNLNSNNSLAEGIYIAGGGSTWNNIISFNSASYGIWYANARGETIHGCFVKGSASDGILIKNGPVRMDCTVDSLNGQPALVIDSSAQTVPGLDINLDVTHTAFASPQNTYAIMASGANVISGYVRGQFEGATGIFTGIPATLELDLPSTSWTPSDGSGAGLIFTNVSANYSRSGNVVTLNCVVTYPTTASTNAAKIGGFPFVVANISSANAAAGSVASGQGLATAELFQAIGNFAVGQFIDAISGASIQNVALSGKTVRFSVSYPVN